MAPCPVAPAQPPPASPVPVVTVQCWLWGADVLGTALSPQPGTGYPPEDAPRAVLPLLRRTRSYLYPLHRATPGEALPRVPQGSEPGSLHWEKTRLGSNHFPLLDAGGVELASPSNDVSSLTRGLKDERETSFLSSFCASLGRRRSLGATWGFRPLILESPAAERGEQHFSAARGCGEMNFKS